MLFSEDEVERYSRQIVLDDIGYEGQSRIKAGGVSVLGLGGLGSPIALQLAAMGVGFLRVVDRDVVELSNIHRQSLYTTEDLGYPKAEVAERRLKALNPRLEVEALTASINEDSVGELVRGVDIVLDGLDSIETRYVVNRACVEAGLPYIYGAAIETIGSTTTILPHETPCLECFAPNLEDDQLPKCGTEGVHPSILTVVASIQVSEAIRLLTGKRPNLAGRLLYFDVKDLSYDQVEIERQHTCPVCGDHPSSPPKPVRRRLIQDLCGREHGKRVFTITPKENLDLSISGLTKRLERRGFDVAVKAKMGLTFRYGSDISVSVLSSGVAIVVGAKLELDALKIYRDLVIDEMGVDAKRVDPTLPALLAQSS